MPLDPITLEVLSTRFAETVATMEHLPFHSGYSTILRESYDGSAVLTDREGHAFLSGLGIHLTPYHLAIQGILKEYPLETMRQGDAMWAGWCRGRHRGVLGRSWAPAGHTSYAPARRSSFKPRGAPGTGNLAPGNRRWCWMTC